jgi:hypothetical protein
LRTGRFLALAHVAVFERLSLPLMLPLESLSFRFVPALQLLRADAGRGPLGSMTLFLAGLLGSLLLLELGALGSLSPFQLTGFGGC